MCSSTGPNCDIDHYLVKTKVSEGTVGTQNMKGMGTKKWDIQKLLRKQGNETKVSEKN
jgi:hypothetical protein